MSTRRSARLAAAGTGAAMARPSARTRTSRQLRETGCRLLNLPAELLGPVLHLAGCPTRLVCRQFRAAYGPLQKGLHLHHISTRRDLLTLVPPPPASPTHSKLHTLVLTLPRPPTAALLSALPAAFPALRSLHLIAPGVPPSNACSALAPLNPTLTHLALTAEAPAVRALASALPSLRSLHLHQPGSVAQAAILSALDGVGSRLTGLQSLQVVGSIGRAEAGHLPGLASALPHLTRLTLKAWLSASQLDPPAAEALASAWPQLADLELGFDPYGVVPQGVAAALARRTTLTRLVISSPGSPEWAQLHALPGLRTLQVHQAWGPPQCWSALAADWATVTRLVLQGSRFRLDDELAGHLARMSHSLLSLELQMYMPRRGHLVHLSCLTRLQDLTLDQTNCGVASYEQAVSEEQAASGLAAGLSSLRCLRIRDLVQRQVARPLVSCLGVHGKLRELQIGKWDPRWPVRLAAVADTLVRLTVNWFWVSTESFPLLISSLKGLERLLYLHVNHRWTRHSHCGDPRGEYGVQQPEWVEGRDPPGDKPLPPEPDATQWPEWRQLVAGSHAAARGAASSSAAQMIWLPPQLRVLVVEDMSQLGQAVQAALRAAVRGQGCVMQETALPVEWDNCVGYEEGASLEWLRAHGRL